MAPYSPLMSGPYPRFPDWLVDYQMSRSNANPDDRSSDVGPAWGQPGVSERVERPAVLPVRTARCRHLARVPTSRQSLSKCVADGQKSWLPTRPG